MQHDKKILLRITYDGPTKAAYIHFVDEIDSGAISRTVPVEAKELRGMVNVDLDDKGRVLGVEFLNATAVLPPGLLAALKR